MRKADRLFQIIQFLRSRRLTTAQWLAERLNVSVRTIYRDIQDLGLSGVPIEGEAGMGYMLRYGYDLPALMFNADELYALVLGVRMVSAHASHHLKHSAESALSKIFTTIPAQQRYHIQHTKLFAPSQPNHHHKITLMDVLHPAILNTLKVEIGYTTPDHQYTQRIIWPLGIFYWSSGWTTVAWCELRHDFRHFRLDRMAHCVLLTDHFSCTSHQSLDAFLKQCQSS